MTKEQINLTEEYGEYLYIQGLSKYTIHNYKYYVSRLLEYLEMVKLEFTDVRVKEAQEYQGWILESGKNLAPGTVLNILKSAVSFFNYLKAKKIVYANPFLKIKKIRDERKIPGNVLNEKEMQEVLREIRKFEEEKTMKRKVRRYKAHVIAELMYSTGMRILEVTNLTVGNIDFEAGVITIEGAKKGGVRVCFLNEYAKDVLANYVNLVKEYTTYRWHTKNTLFGCSVTSVLHTIDTELKKVCKKLNLKEITSHAFRHSFGTHLLKTGCSIRYIQAFLGHRRLRSTEVYTKIDREDLKKAMEKYHPRKWKENQWDG